ncbi:TnsD family Tn7-like transposition protein [Neobacillus niacini]|uniref:TnsD family Tn7-like transposition protein n=1 Tax=Neobacillus niacini TaxID=86668 RepID=UPI002864B6E9|nr:TnsD family Tn7-like transposition protein [Neobacillus niacini]MDR7002821.1 transposase-like protein [Neobacillus niacini]
MKKLLYFPEGYPDEDFRSIVYRYHIRSDNIGIKESRKELFNMSSNSLGHLPRNLQFFLSKLPYGSKVLVEDIFDHTWFPLLKPFITKERLSIINNDIMNGTNMYSNYAGKLMSSRNVSIFSNEIRYCLECMKTDDEKYGECYVHLQHQLAFINFCHQHNSKLLVRCPKCGKNFFKKKDLHLTVTPCCTNTYEKIDETLDIQFKKTLLSEFVFFKEHAKLMSNDTLYQKIIIILGIKGYISFSGMIDRSRIIDDFLKFYENKILESVGFDKDIVFSKSSSGRLLNQSEMVNYILFYFLLIIFLTGSIKNFIEHSEVFSITLPFGSGPWNCYNPICPCFEQKPIQRCERKKNGDNFIGLFLCPVCGFKYSREWKKGTTQENNNYSVKSRGYLWMSKVYELYGTGYKCPEIAKIVKADTETVRRYLNKVKNSQSDFIQSLMRSTGQDLNKSFSLYETYTEVAATKIKEDTFEVREKYRKRILELKRSKIDLKRMDAHKELRKEYLWLLANDADWFNRVLPPMDLTKIDYSKLDEEMKYKIKVAAKKVYSSNPARRIGKHLIINVLDEKEKNRILAYLSKLPKTKQILESHIESIDDYQVRNVPYIVSKLKSYGYKNITFNSIRDYNKTYRKCKEETIKRIEKVLEELTRDN